MLKFYSKKKKKKIYIDKIIDKQLIKWLIFFIQTRFCQIHKNQAVYDKVLLINNYTNIAKPKQLPLT